MVDGREDRIHSGTKGRPCSIDLTRDFRSVDWSSTIAQPRSQPRGGGLHPRAMEGADRVRVEHPPGGDERARGDRPPGVPPGDRPGGGGPELHGVDGGRTPTTSGSGRWPASCLWMGGGPSQLDTFDPKPGTEGGGDHPGDRHEPSPGSRSPTTSPRLAQVMKDVALIRSMTNKEGNHQRASYQLHTGYAPSGTVKHPELRRGRSPAELGDPKFDLPQIVCIGARDDTTPGPASSA